MKSKVLITGGLGFIGNELARQLMGEAEVALLDNRNRVAPDIGDLRDLRVFEEDLTQYDAVERVLREYQPQTIFHLAAIHYIPECNADPERTLRVNVEGTQGLLRAAVLAGVGHFLLASSGAVYADAPSLLREDSSVAPSDIYAWSKWFAEELCRWHAAQDGLKVTVCRLFNTYGPRETNAHIIPEIIAQLKQGNVLRLGNVATTRDLVYVSDVAEALRRMARLVPQSSRVVNVSSGVHATMRDVVGVIGELLGRTLVIESDPSRLRRADKGVQVADIGLLEQLTGWRPGTDLRSGLKRLLVYEGLLAG